MTISYYRDLAKTDTLIVDSSQGIYAIDLTTIKVGSMRRVGSVPTTAQVIGAADVGRILICACNRTIADCESRMGAIE